MPPLRWRKHYKSPHSYTGLVLMSGLPGTRTNDSTNSQVIFEVSEEPTTCRSSDRYFLLVYNALRTNTMSSLEVAPTILAQRTRQTDKHTPCRNVHPQICNSTQRTQVSDTSKSASLWSDYIINEHYHFITSSDRFPVPVRSAVKSNLITCLVLPKLI